jgi:maltose alpha-D-glucosyltransferase / alpha-amylase
LTTTFNSSPGGTSGSNASAPEKKFASATDPLWFKDAIIYELHVRAFFDSNNDGIGDFQGLIQKLDYLQNLGVTCLWLLPFFPSPLRDDGYDISDYMSVHPTYGTVEDFKLFLNAAHERGLQVMIELVVNHTSDQHPWFQAARKAAPGSPEREFYVWHDTDQKYKDARIIFTDTEKSNWTWDPVAGAYYWHRFFSHQPDLNYDNPQVIEEVVKVMRYWLDMGVDGLRTDAIPYLVEREGTNCENLPETHAIMKRIRAEIDTHYSGRVLLAEANQWPSDVLPYFGDGDECHMAFHFPLMPRIYMALRQEDRLPIIDILAQTPAIPDTCQWGLFLRNHDELTLEMVTADERDYMYYAYSSDPRMRINIGIRRRLAPLVDNNRRRIELLNSLLFSFPGTPILYYGDEIGMGDNIYLGDRNGVRTPMQWSADRNAGFSRANPARLYSPVVMDPVWGYEAINVEAQQGDPSSLLSWMRNMIALRKLFHVFGRGSLKFLSPENRKILAYVRELGDERILCVANLSRFAQPFSLDLQEYEGMMPVEMLGYVEFPRMGKQPYPLTLGPYSFLWFELQPAPADSEDTATQPQHDGLSVVGTAQWNSILTGDNLRRLESDVLPGFVVHQRWFGGKARALSAIRIDDWAAVKTADEDCVIALCEMAFEEGQSETYLLPFAVHWNAEEDAVRDRTSPGSMALIHSSHGEGVLLDGLSSDAAARRLLEIIQRSDEIKSVKGVFRGTPAKGLATLIGGSALPVRRGAGEQSNTSILFGDRLIMKVFRRVQGGPNPDYEISRYLCESAGFRNVPVFGGVIDYVSESGETSTVALLQGLIANEGDGWQWTLEELDRYFERCARLEFPEGALPASPIGFLAMSESEAPSLAREHAGLYLDAAQTIGRRTGEMHVALASPTTEPDFAPEEFTALDITESREDLSKHAADAFHILKKNISALPDDVVDRAALVLSKRGAIVDRFRHFVIGDFQALRTRIHGDYHLGQLLRARNDFYVLDFEGEPARPLSERRRKQSPLKDVASMLRSFSYASFAALMRYTSRRPEHFKQLEPWAKLWEQAVSIEFLRTYRETVRGAHVIPSQREAFEALLEAYVLDKALYELLYELNNRPAWVHIPLAGILALPIRE